VPARAWLPRYAAAIWQDYRTLNRRWTVRHCALQSRCAVAPRHPRRDFANEEQAGYVDIVLQLLAVVGLVLLNGFFVATEFSLVSVRRTRIETLSAEANRRAQHVFSVIKDLDGYIAAT
jgi:hypothetical protein